MPKNLVVLTGAGISAESGIKTFRDSNGLWENHDIMEVASTDGWKKNPALVLDFYNKRRAQLIEVKPNPGHQTLVELEKYFNVQIITQNVDDLHERAGSQNVLHLHGELLKVRSTQNPDYVVECTSDINLGDTCPNGHQLRPHIVWFYEDVPEFDKAKIIAVNADILLVIGTSLQVYPAASLVEYVRPNVPIIYLDPNPDPETRKNKRFFVMPHLACEGMQALKEQLIAMS
jgi:NAD-dependent deacetylase